MFGKEYRYLTLSLNGPPFATTSAELGVFQVSGGGKWDTYANPSGSQNAISRSAPTYTEELAYSVYTDEDEEFTDFTGKGHLIIPAAADQMGVPKTGAANVNTYTSPYDGLTSAWGVQLRSQVPNLSKSNLLLRDVGGFAIITPDGEPSPPPPDFASIDVRVFSLFLKLPQAGVLRHTQHLLGRHPY